MLDQTNEQLTPAGNIDDGKLTSKQVYARARELGKQEGKGENSRPGLFLTIVEGGKARAIGKDDVPKLFADYARSCASSLGVGYRPQSSEKQQVSKFGVALRLGELPHVDGMVLMEKVVAFQKAQRSTEEGQHFSSLDGMVKVARYQVTQSPSAMLADDVINGLLLKPAKDLPEEADRLDKIQRAAAALRTAKEAPVTDETASVLAEMEKALEGRIQALGGTTADRKRAAKQEATVQELIDRTHAEQAKLVVMKGAEPEAPSENQRLAA